MYVEVTDNGFNLDSVIAGMKELHSRHVVVGPAAKSKDAKIVVIASANEFGAEITSKKAIAKLWHMLVEADLLDPKKISLFLWMKRKQKIVIPERSFMRATAKDQKAKDHAVELAQLTFRNFLSGKADAMSVLEMVGQAYIDKIKERMRDSIPPANHELTLANKRGSTTLYDTGSLSDSIQLEVV